MAGLAHACGKCAVLGAGDCRITPTSAVRLYRQVFRSELLMAVLAELIFMAGSTELLIGPGGYGMSDVKVGTVNVDHGV